MPMTVGDVAACLRVLLESPRPIDRAADAPSANAALSAAPLTAAQLAVRVCDITEDSRTVVPGSLFIARKGLKADGKAFARDAVRAGAVALLTDDAALPASDRAFASVPTLVVRDVMLASALLAEVFYEQPSRALAVTGITGTNGKTSTASFLWQLLNHGLAGPSSGRRCGLIGTVSIDDGTEVAPAHMTTPPALEVSRLLRRMVEAGYDAAAMEISSHALDQRRADALALRVAVFTNLSGDHLDYHKTMHAYAAAKARLFELLLAGALAVVNADDPAHGAMIARCKARVARCSAFSGRDADATVTIEDQSMSGMTLALRGAWGDIRAGVPLLGAYNAMNVLQACVAAHECGATREQLELALTTLAPPAGRLERVTDPSAPVQVFVDYAHSDDSLSHVLAAVAGVMPGKAHLGQSVHDAAGAARGGTAPGRLWAVFGCGGDRDTSKRPRMGKAACERADMVVVTSDNPRTEKPSDIIDQILTGVPANFARERLTVQVDRARAIRHALTSAKPGDAVVIAGKGHETEQILPDGKGGTISTRFDDREVARGVLAELGIAVATGKSLAARAFRTRDHRAAGARGTTR